MNSVKTFLVLLLAISSSLYTREAALASSTDGGVMPVAAAEIPEGFELVTLETGSSPGKLCEADAVCETLFKKINRVDDRRIAAGKSVLLPVDTAKASEYVPIPGNLADTRGEREVRVYLDSQYFGAYENGALLFWGPISSGTKSHPTWPGEFVVNYKQRHKRSIKYNNAPMPYSINYDGPYFIHQQALPGHPASHGCVRLLEDDAKRLFGWVRNGDPVTVL
ncbi:L,D-transpeptidase [Prosthecochloris sp. GSB1]|uniref:L,D-transpeptidase n=1 Tax=Prosthecochloris sp. GSB1 TaxID=281093 RepID=UPI000B8CBA45|nr:L,D-transpeptidase [Prosthecochloris sp. GSB1]ASQ90397.1 L,D-transpeptidase [Prosthecochloris sp. GSB1]